MVQLTPQIIEFIKRKENRKLFFEICQAWDISTNSLYRWLRDNDSHKLTHPQTINIIRKHNTEKLRICERREVAV